MCVDFDDRILSGTGQIWSGYPILGADIPGVVEHLYALHSRIAQKRGRLARPPRFLCSTQDCTVFVQLFLPVARTMPLRSQL